MRREKIIKIQIDESTHKEYKLFELRPKDLFSLWDNMENVSYIDLIKKLLDMGSNIPYDELVEMYPSDWEIIEKGFMELNGFFLTKMNILYQK